MTLWSQELRFLLYLNVSCQKKTTISCFPESQCTDLSIPTRIIIVKCQFCPSLSVEQVRSLSIFIFPQPSPNSKFNEKTKQNNIKRLIIDAKVKVRHWKWNKARESVGCFSLCHTRETYSKPNNMSIFHRFLSLFNKKTAKKRLKMEKKRTIGVFDLLEHLKEPEAERRREIPGVPNASKCHWMSSLLLIFLQIPFRMTFYRWSTSIQQPAEGRFAAEKDELRRTRQRYSAASEGQTGQFHASLSLRFQTRQVSTFSLFSDFFGGELEVYGWQNSTSNRLLNVVSE